MRSKIAGPIVGLALAVVASGVARAATITGQRCVMKTKLLGLIGVILLGASPAAATTYDMIPYVTESSYTSDTLTVTGSITTNGATGILTALDITAWSLTLVAGSGAPFTLSGSNSEYFVFGNDLTANSSGLFFNFGDSSTTDPGYFAFQSPCFFCVTPPTTPFAFIQWCSTGAEAATGCGDSLEMGDPASGTGTLPAYEYFTVAEYGEELQIATVAPTPLPPALPLFATGLGVMGLLGWRRKRKKNSAVVAAA